MEWYSIAALCFMAFAVGLWWGLLIGIRRAFDRGVQLGKSLYRDQVAEMLRSGDLLPGRRLLDEVIKEIAESN